MADQRQRRNTVEVTVTIIREYSPDDLSPDDPEWVSADEVTTRIVHTLNTNFGYGPRQEWFTNSLASYNGRSLRQRLTFKRPTWARRREYR